MKLLPVIIACSLIPVGFLQAADKPNLTPEGAFSSPESIVVAPQVTPGAWTFNPGDYAAHGIEYAIQSKEGVSYFRVTATQSGATWIHTIVDLPTPAPASITFSFRVRTTELTKQAEPGPEWYSAQVQVYFFGKDKSQPLKHEILYRTVLNSGDWVEVEKPTPVPAGATSFQVQAGLWGYLGHFDLANFKSTPKADL